MISESAKGDFLAVVVCIRPDRLHSMCQDTFVFLMDIRRPKTNATISISDGDSAERHRDLHKEFDQDLESLIQLKPSADLSCLGK